MNENLRQESSVSSAIQRIGRAGHQVGQVSRGTVFPIHSQDALEAAVLASEVLGQDIESIKCVEPPLDVLAQVIISMTGVEAWDVDGLKGTLPRRVPSTHLVYRKKK